MCSLVPFLEFTGESASMFSNRRLPTLDVEIWWESGEVSYSFFKKPEVPNRVILKGTALPESLVHASLTQEIVRRMKNFCERVAVDERREILSRFGQKLVNLGHSLKSSCIMMVHGVTKYFEILRKHKLPQDHPEYKPMHLSKEYEQSNRQIKKQLAKVTWFQGNGGSDI